MGYNSSKMSKNYSELGVAFMSSNNQEIDIPLYKYTLLLSLPYFLIMLKIFPNSNTSITIYSIILLSLATPLILYNYRKMQINTKQMGLFILFACIISTIIFLNLFGKNYSFSELSYNGNALITFLYVFLIFILFRHATLSEKQIELTLSMIVFLAIIFCFFNIVLYHNTILSLSSLQSSYKAQFCSLFLGRNQFGSFLYLSIIAYITLTSHFKKKFNIFIFFLLFVNLFLTFSRSANLATIIFLIICLLYMDIKKKIYLYLIIGTLLFILLNNNYIGEIINNFLIRPEAGSAGRLGRWEGVFQYVKDDWSVFFGISATGLKKILLSIGVEQIDNAYFDILFTYGIIGLFAYCGVLVNSFRKAIFVKQNEKYIKIYIITISAIISFAIYSIFESMVLFEAGLQQWIAILLLIILPNNYFKKRE